MYLMCLDNCIRSKVRSNWKQPTDRILRDRTEAKWPRKGPLASGDKESAHDDRLLARAHLERT